MDLNFEKSTINKLDSSRPDWFQLGAQTFQITQNYSQLAWKTLDINKYIIVPTKFGGPVALVPTGQDPQTPPENIEIWTAAGVPLSKIYVTLK